MQIRRRLLFALIVLALALAGLELGARLFERRAKPTVPAEPPAEPSETLPQLVTDVPTDADSPLQFQQLYESYLYPSDLPGPPQWMLFELDRPGQTFEREKPPEQLRIVILGASQAGALGLSDSAGYARQLERLLRARHPRRDIRVIALARTGYASPQLAFLARKTLATIKPDLVLAIFGHNERLDIKAYSYEDKVPPEVLAFSRTLRRTSALVRLLAPSRPKKPVDLPPGGQALPLMKNQQVWDSFWVGRLERSLEAIHEETQRVGSELILCFPPSNLAYAVYREWWWAEDFQENQDLVRARHWLRYGLPERAKQHLLKYAEQHPGPAAHWLLGRTEQAIGNREAAVAHWETCRQLLETTPNLHPEIYLYLSVQVLNALGRSKQAQNLVQGYMMTENDHGGRASVIGLVLRSVGRTKEARELLEKSRNFDELAIRANHNVRETMRYCAERWDSPFLDLDALLAETLPDRINDWRLFIDYCHLNPQGHARLAGVLVKQVESLLKLRPRVNIDPFRPARDIEKSLQKRTHDFPEADRWLGVCNSMWKISDEETVGDNCLFEPPFDDPLTLCFVANRKVEILATTTSIHEAIALYRQALSIDPDFSPAKRNLELLKKRFGEAVFP